MIIVYIGPMTCTDVEAVESGTSKFELHNYNVSLR